MLKKSPYIFCLFIQFSLLFDLNGKGSTDHQIKVGQTHFFDHYLLSVKDPLHQQLAFLFQNPHLFQKQNDLRGAGFKVKSGNLRTKLMVIGHSSLPEHLIKKFPDSVPQNTQLNNFFQRIKGAEAIRNVIEDHHFKHLIVPNKCLYQLPKQFPSQSYALVVEKFDIYDDWDNPKGKSRKLFYNMDLDVLTELCTLLYEVGGCDSLPRNIPFTHSGQIAFVDTEHVGTVKTKGQFHRDTLPHLNPELQTYALDLWNKLEKKKDKKY